MDPKRDKGENEMSDDRKPQRYPIRSPRLALAAIALLALLGWPDKAGAQSANEPELPYSPSLDLGSMDKSFDPCVNFYQYACGGWRAKNPIPGDQTSWSVYGKLYQDNLKFLRGILEQAGNSTDPRDAVTQKVGDFYASCVDESGIEKSGLGPLEAELDVIARLNSVHELAPLLARLQMVTYGFRSILFRGGSGQDPDDSAQIIASPDQGGLGLPDRDYYTKEDAKSKETRERYVQHVQKIFELLGDSP
jgi:putative endopeptidase